MSNGNTINPQNIIIKINSDTVPVIDIIEYVEIAPGSDRYTIKNGIAGGYAKVRQFPNDEQVSLKLFKRDFAHKLITELYLPGVEFNLYIKDINTGMAYQKTDAVIGTADNYTLGDGEPLSFTILTPGLNISKV